MKIVYQRFGKKDFKSRGHSFDKSISNEGFKQKVKMNIQTDRLMYIFYV